MPDFVLNRNYVLGTTKGHRIKFIKDQPVHVPPSCIPEAVALGATPADGSEPALPVPPPTGEPPEASDPEKRKVAILNAIKLLVARNDPDDFGADNAPKLDALRKAADFKLDMRERNEVWQTYHDLAAEGAL